MIRVADRVSNPLRSAFVSCYACAPASPRRSCIVAFQWPRGVRTIVASGVWQAIETRLNFAWHARERLIRAVRSELLWEENATKG